MPLRHTRWFLVALLAAGAAAADEPAPGRLSWERRGLASFVASAEAARLAHRRILVGLSGSPT